MCETLVAKWVGFLFGTGWFISLCCSCIFFCCSLLKLCQIFVVEYCYIFCSLSATYAQSRIDFYNLERDVFKQDWICITMCVQNVFMAWASSF